MAEDECMTSPAVPPSGAEATTAEDGYSQAEADHQATYGGTSDLWNREWADAYLALVQLFDELSA